MPEAVGELLIYAVFDAGLEVSGASIAGITVASAVGSAAILGATIGLQYALNNPNVPKPENGAQPLKQAIPPRIRGYWTNRLAGNYVLFLAAGGNSQDMLAFHSGRIEEVLQVYLHDQSVNIVPWVTDGVTGTVQQVGSEQFADGCVQIQIFYGTDTQNAGVGMLNPTSTSGVWTSDFAAKGIACLAMTCFRAPNPESFTTHYPQGLPLPSVVAKCSPVWDPRDPSQSRTNVSTWKASANPVLQLIDYITLKDGGMGEDLDDVLPSSNLAQWMIEADLCDQLAGSAPKYASAGWYQFDNPPDQVIGKILSTFDGWMVEDGEGHLALAAGVYREPTDPPITAQDMVGWSVKQGMADEDTVNQLDVSWTNPTLAYVSDQIPSVRDEVSISESGIVRAKPLDLTWVQNADQATRLGLRALLAANPKMSGTLVTTLYGLNYLGKRWVKVQFPIGQDLQDCVVEIQDKAQIDLLNDRVTFNWNLIDQASLAGL